MSVALISQKGQILVPKHLRRRLGLQPGGKVHLAEEEGRLVLTPVPSDPIEAATGFVFSSLSLQEATIPDRNRQFVYPVDNRSRNPGLGRILLK